MEDKSSDMIPGAGDEFRSVSDKVEGLLAAVMSMGILIPDVAEVRNYLCEYDDIVDLTLYLCKITKDKLNQEAQLALEVFHDPECDHRTLTLYVRQESYNDDLIQKLDELDDLYCDKLADKKGYILVMTDFQNPRA
jgi:hypothetical protein